MSCAEHIIENAISAIHNGWTFEQWISQENKLNIPYIKSDPKEIWQMANYVYYSDCWKHWTEF